VDAYDREGRTKLATGVLIAVDNQIDTATGTVKLKAEFANEDLALFPNQFVNVRLQIETLTDATLVPTAAIQRGAPGTFVYQVKEDRSVSVAAVKLGPSQAEVTVIDSGIAPGDLVVIDGTDKLREGSKVELIVRDAPTGAGAAGARRGAGKGDRPPGSGPPGEAQRQKKGGG
jgi:multidrug efflux system membrane fusion protein